MRWEYKVESFNMADKWSKKSHAKEIERFNARLNAYGRDGWEMIGYEAVALYGNLSNKLKGHAYLLFLKRPAVETDGV